MAKEGVIPPSELLWKVFLVFTGKDIEKKIGGIGKVIVQAVRPKPIAAPLQLEIAIILHHSFGSRQLIIDYGRNVPSSIGEKDSYSLEQENYKWRHIKCWKNPNHFLSWGQQGMDDQIFQEFAIPPYFKAFAIQKSNSDLSNIVLKLGGFHNQMSYIYAAEIVTHVLSGKAFSRPERAMLLVDDGGYATSAVIRRIVEEL
ncbi:hypothetical protein DAPPUDRAFT_334446 [Daphnia pulex]|uniref:Uncharacterized protein n=1 Tax=Daphnia pulex TaxID=6669 RepID=E9HVK0_DAPPU|nr:hypothetical protein DAPPUDRAFT_334446 [Daphnia pulex]|eukprot:EFX64214.1 hypothetical protein DAPPUDRAFT_334446 [Daphnia pulex]